MGDLYLKIGLLNRIKYLTSDMIDNILTYEEKNKIFNSSEYIFQKFVEKCIKNNIIVFKDEQAEKYFYDNVNRFYKIYIEDTLKYVKLPEELLYCLILDENMYHLTSLLSIINQIKIIDKHWSILSDDLKVSILSNLPDQYKKKYIEKYNDPEYSLVSKNLVFSLSNDEEKMKYYNLVDKSKRSSLISTLNNSETKKKYLTPFTHNKGEIISSLDNDDYKIFYLLKYIFILSYAEKESIIRSFEDSNNIIKYYHMINSSYYKMKLLLSNSIDDNTRNKLFELSDKKTCCLVYDSIKDEKIRRKFLNSINNPHYLYNVLITIASSDLYEDKIYILKKLNSIVKIKDIMTTYVKTLIDRDFQLEYLLYTEDVNYMFVAISHQESLPKYEEKYIPIFYTLAKHFGINIDHLIHLSKLTSCSILKFLNHTNVRDAINLDDESFNKYIKLFSKENYTMNSDVQNTILNAIIQRQFKLLNNDKIHIFTNTLNAFSNKNYKEAYNSLNLICSEVDLLKYNITYYDLIKGLKEEDRYTISLFNKIVSEYLTIIRNQYLKRYLKQYNSKVSKETYDSKDIVSYLLDYFEIDDIVDYFENDIYEEDFNNLFYSKDVLKEALKFKKYPNNFLVLSSETKEVLNNLNKVDMYSLFKYNYSFSNVKLKYEIPVIKPDDLLDIMCKVNTLALKDNILSNNILYTTLYNYLNKYKLLGSAFNFHNIISSISLDFNQMTVAGFINNFKSIYDEIERSKKSNPTATFSFIKILELSNVCESYTDIYSYIFGSDNYYFLKRNPEPYSSAIVIEERLKRAVKLLSKLRKREYITVPPIDENIYLPNGKEINILLGNTNELINFTYGERTGACMRIGGAGESLFEFCLLNENGFHISFNDPSTGKLISRVSGFRNGNTVFLNQLRFSLSQDFDTEDLIKVCMHVSKRIIELSKNSCYPINNVVISGGYAFNDYIKNEQRLNVSNIKKTLGNFYSDVGSKAIVTATSNEDNTLVPIELGSSKVERYRVLRNKVKVYKGVECKTAIGHIYALDELYSGISIDELDIKPSDKELVYMGEDWFISLDKKNNIETYIMKNSKDKESASNELNKYLTILEDEINVEKVKQYIYK